MAEKTFCVICDKDVEIVKVITHGNYDELILSCDHIGRKLNLSPEEREKETSLHWPYVAQSKTAEGEMSISPQQLRTHRKESERFAIKMISINFINVTGRTMNTEALL
jgi:hypothetical protein